ncbi:hypothetical protein NE237_000222 [Protea cynaroides]|uniref:Uncharacterized protein n=1 Tax=Protea cynaroides TaxID=273540 RepID=A0A9Q0KR09_9MAGN|nr:hypothetical protein NE237_000222 [Protea cynaroides]
MHWTTPHHLRSSTSLVLKAREQLRKPKICSFLQGTEASKESLESGRVSSIAPINLLSLLKNASFTFPKSFVDCLNKLLSLHPSPSLASLVMGALCTSTPMKISSGIKPEFLGKISSVVQSLSPSTREDPNWI